ncbi:PfkB family carbohydrate kinase [Planctobacterium marinum]|uniref:ADP-heptose synthase n=1 Tax=Planctobacterium marinum TaxID=1631968 RepID=A0AA48HMZ6_9ALTE|nr:ADP-heptose synthase [Planctobacterium marinum]
MTRKTHNKLVFISGIFNVLHPGHIRMFRFASELGGRLVIGLLKKENLDANILADAERLESLKAISFIDDVVMLNDLEHTLLTLRPDIVLKGNEFKSGHNIEQSIIQAWGGELVFSSGESTFNSTSILTSGSLQADFDLPSSYFSYIKRHNIQPSFIASALDQLSNLKVAVIGDIILDEYVDCDPVGLSREDPTIVVSPVEKKCFIGGAAIVACHTRSFGAKVDFYSVCGKDKKADWLIKELNDKGVHCNLVNDETRPTTVKKRYRSGNKTLLRVNEFRSHPLNTRAQNALLQAIESQIHEYDLIMFSDFSYGLLSEDTVQKIASLAEQHDVPMVADSQTSSQKGDLNKFRRMRLVTPTELEARQATNVLDSSVGLAQVVEVLINRLQPGNVVMTLAEAGAMVANKNSNQRPQLDSLPALNKNPVDVSGAGDLLLVTTSLLMIAECDVWHAALMGMIASAIHISTVGNEPINAQELRRYLHKMQPRS